MPSHIFTRPRHLGGIGGLERPQRGGGAGASGDGDRSRIIIPTRSTTPSMPIYRPKTSQRRRPAGGPRGASGPRRTISARPMRSLPRRPVSRSKPEIGPGRGRLPTEMSPAITWERYPQAVGNALVRQGDRRGPLGRHDAARAALMNWTASAVMMCRPRHGLLGDAERRADRRHRGLGRAERGRGGRARALMTGGGRQEDAVGKAPVTPGQSCPRGNSSAIC